MWKYLLVLMLIWNPCFAEVDLKFLLSKKLSTRQLYKKLEPFLTKTKNVNYSKLKKSVIYNDERVTSSLFYHKNGKLIWAHLRLSEAISKTDLLQEKVYRTLGSSKIKNSDRSQGFEYELWQFTKERSCEVLKKVRHFSHYYEMQIKYVKGLSMFCTKGRRDKFKVKLRVPLSVCLGKSSKRNHKHLSIADIRAYQYQSKQNFTYKHRDVWDVFWGGKLEKKASFETWQYHKKIFQLRKIKFYETDESRYSNLNHTYSINPKFYNTMTKPLSRSKGYPKFMSFLWKNLNNNKPVILSLCLATKSKIELIRYPSIKKRYGVPHFPTIKNFNMTFPNNQLLRNQDEEISEYNLLVTAMDRVKKTLTFSLNNGAEITLAISQVYGLTNKAYVY